MKYLIYLSILFSATLNAGSIHKWVDENGETHYGDAPPITINSKKVRVTGAPSEPGKALPRLTASDSQADNATATSDTANNVPVEQAEAACKIAKKDLDVINRSNRIQLKSADGSLQYMTDEEIAERKKSAEADIEQYCP